NRAGFLRHTANARRSPNTARAVSSTELEEETGLVATHVHYAFQFHGLRSRHFVFAARVGETIEAIPSNEIVRCQWMQLDEILCAEASIPTKGIAAIFLKQTQCGNHQSLREAIELYLCRAPASATSRARAC
ncbi:NUDIX domain-containing protein, partial [Caballeronia arvi]|uniref:NUDIX domain-containing protein n=1 Tax=Caballeronia arvi TaxID=1777135 RepID=UPI000A61DA2B